MVKKRAQPTIGYLSLNLLECIESDVNWGNTASVDRVEKFVGDSKINNVYEIP
jgi:hypothetical protein